MIKRNEKQEQTSPAFDRPRVCDVGQGFFVWSNNYEEIR
jgi:hypothetical protein